MDRWQLADHAHSLHQRQHAVTTASEAIIVAVVPGSGTAAASVRRATRWPACRLVTTSLPRMTVVTACRFPIHRFAARNRLQPADERI